MIILLAVLALVVVNALRDSPWGLFAISATIPIALFMGPVDEQHPPGKVAEATAIGIVLLMRRWSAASGYRRIRPGDQRSPGAAHQPAWAVMVYGFFASVLRSGPAGPRATTCRRS